MARATSCAPEPGNPAKPTISPRRDIELLDSNMPLPQIGEAPGGQKRAARALSRSAREKKQAAPQNHLAQITRGDLGNRLIIGHQLTVPQDGNAVADFEDFLIVMRDEHEGDAFAFELRMKSNSDSAVCHGERRGWLVEDDQPAAAVRARAGY